MDEEQQKRANATTQSREEVAEAEHRENHGGADFAKNPYLDTTGSGRVRFDLVRHLRRILWSE